MFKGMKAQCLRRRQGSMCSGEDAQCCASISSAATTSVRIRHNPYPMPYSVPYGILVVVQARGAAHGDDERAIKACAHAKV